MLMVFGDIVATTLHMANHADANTKVLKSYMWVALNGLMYPKHGQYVALFYQWSLLECY